MKLTLKHWTLILLIFLTLLPFISMVDAKSTGSPKVLPADTRAGQDVFCYSIGQLGYEYVINYRLGVEKRVNEVGDYSNWVMTGWAMHALNQAYTGKHTPDGLRQDLMMECLVTIHYS